jgi:hypothetical protein
MGETQMFSAISKRLTYSNIAATLALVFAMSGGAYALGGHGGGAGGRAVNSTSAASAQSAQAARAGSDTMLASAAKKKAKSKSTTGARGPAGPAGKNGTNGTNGANGAPGEKGAQGPQGPAGVGTEGKEGKEGKEGPQGAPGTTGFTKTLPKGSTEKGVWSVDGYVPSEEGLRNGVSFVIPLSSAPAAVHYITAASTEGNLKEWAENGNHEAEEIPAKTGCTGSVEEPGAEKGNLCVFARSETSNQIHAFSGEILPSIVPLNKQSRGTNEASPFGFGVNPVSKEAGMLELEGTWAVTAE